MSERALQRVKTEFGARVLESSNFRGDEAFVVAPSDWLEAATFLRNDAECGFDHFVDLTAVDYPEREPELPRFDVVLHLRSLASKQRIRMKTRVRVDQPVASLSAVWTGADWTEREVFDMFGIRFEGHPDLRRILMYDEFVGYPLRKDYPISRTQPLVPYRDVPPAKLAPFGDDMGSPFGRIDWLARLGGGDRQVSPAISVQQAQRAALSAGTEDENGR